MTTRVEVGKTGEMQDGSMKKIAVQDKEILLVKSGGEYYAVDAKCPHMGGDFSKGTLEGTVVTCPRHGSQFDVTDGHVVRWLKGSGLMTKISSTIKSPHSLNVYTVVIEDDTVNIEV